MAIDNTYFQILATLATQIRANLPQGGPIPAACLSYPDVLVDESLLNDALGEGSFGALTPRTDAGSVLAWHGVSASDITLYDTSDILAGLGINPSYFDIASFRGPEEILDLNEPLPTTLCGKFDLVIDTGTLEHCFNVGGAFKSMCELVSLGGHILTMAPMTIVNHGFWNFSPTAYWDAFGQNGFEILLLRGVRKENGRVEIFEIMDKAASRFAVDGETVAICCAKKIAQQQFRWPIQSKYKSMMGGGT